MNDLNINTTKLDEIRNRVALKALEDEVESQNKAQSIGSAIEAFLNTERLRESMSLTTSGRRSVGRTTVSGLLYSAPSGRPRRWSIFA